VEATLAEEFPKSRRVSQLGLPDRIAEQQVAEKLLAGNLQVECNCCFDEFSTRGTYYALTEFNKTSSISSGWIRSEPADSDSHRRIDSIIMQDTQQMGRAAVKLMGENSTEALKRSMSFCNRNW